MKAKYEIGSKLYFIEKKSNTFTRQRIYMTDSDGVRWYRYEKPFSEFALKEHTVVGTIMTVVEGNIGDGVEYGDHETQYFVTDHEFNILEYEIDQENPHGDCWFTNKDDAEKYMQYLVKQTE